MSRMALNIAHFKKGAVGSLGGHNWYKRGEHDEHSNQDIDPARSKDNIALVLPEEGSFYQDVKSAVEQSTGRVTAASVWISEWVLYPPESLQNPLTADKEELRRFYGDALTWMREQGYHVKLAVVHMDETTVHAHIDTVPLTEDGRLSRKDIYTRVALNNIHTELAAHLANKGWDIQRGESTKEKQVRSKTIPEYKKDAERKKLQLIQETREAHTAAQMAKATNKTLESQVNALRGEAAALEARIEEADEWLNQLPDWPAYDQEAQRAWAVLEQLRQAMQHTFSKGLIFRNRKGEQALLEAIESCRDVIMSAISAMRGFEIREAVPPERQRTKAIRRGLDEAIRVAEQERQSARSLPKKRHEIER